MRELMRAVQEVEMTLYNKRGNKHSFHSLIAIIKHRKAPPRRLHKAVIYLYMPLLFWTYAFWGMLANV